MGTIHFEGNTYAGEVLEDLLVYTVHGCDTFENKLIHIKPGIQKKMVLPHITLGSIIQDNKPTPTSTDGDTSGGKNDYKLSERYLEPQDFMVYIEFNPRDFEEYWKDFQPDGQLIFRELDPYVQAKMLHLLIDRKNQYLEDCIWCSRKGGHHAETITEPSESTQIGGKDEAGEMKYFDGFIARVLANIAGNASENEKASGKVIMAGNTELTTGEQVATALYSMWKACPKHVRKSKKLKILMGYEVWDKYDEYLTKSPNKYTDNSIENKKQFRGIPIITLTGIPEHTIALGKFSDDANSCLWMGVDYATDQTSVKVEPLQNNSELYFFQMRLKVDVNIVLPSEIVVWTAYKNAA